MRHRQASQLGQVGHRRVVALGLRISRWRIGMDFRLRITNDVDSEAISRLIASALALSAWRRVPVRGNLHGMTMISSNPYRGFRFPREVIEHAVWLYHCFSLSLRDI